MEDFSLSASKVKYMPIPDTSVNVQIIIFSRTCITMVTNSKSDPQFIIGNRKIHVTSSHKQNNRYCKYVLFVIRRRKRFVLFAVHTLSAVERFVRHTDFFSIDTVITRSM